MGKSKDLATGAAYQDQTESDTRYANVSGDTFTGLVNITNTYSSDTTEQLRVSDNTGSKLDFFGHANGTKSIQAYADDGSTFYNLNLQPLGGYVTKPHNPFFWTKAGSSSAADHSNGTKVFASNTGTYGSIVETGNNFNTTTGHFTAPVSGVYHFACQVRIDNFGGSYSYLTLWDSGAVAFARDLTSQTGTYNTQSVSGSRYLSANDYVYVLFVTAGDTSTTISADSFFTGHLVG